MHNLESSSEESVFLLGVHQATHSNSRVQRTVDLQLGQLVERNHHLQIRAQLAHACLADAILALALCEQVSQLGGLLG